MRWFLRRRIPEAKRILLVESGTRRIAERVLVSLRRNHGPATQIDLVTCFPGLPEGCPPEPTRDDSPGPCTRVWRSQDYAASPDRRRLLGELLARRYDLIGVICSGEPILLKWKWAIAARIPAKVFIINENADYFWLDYSHWRIVARLMRERAGFAGPSGLRNLVAIGAFPFTLAFLLLYAARVHTMRRLRLLFRPRDAET